MATSEVSIANLALQKLGSKNIVSLSENINEAKAVASCYEALRDKEIRMYLWGFAKTRAILAPHAVQPAFTFSYAFVLPSDFLRLIKPARLGLDWTIEVHEGERAILTNDGDTLQIRYIRKVTDPTLFDPCFVDMLACRIAWHCCERLTQSNTKKQGIMEEYNVSRAEARKTSAFELPSQAQPADEWLAARWTGQLVNSEWNEE